MDLKEEIKKTAQTLLEMLRDRKLGRLDYSPIEDVINSENVNLPHTINMGKIYIMWVVDIKEAKTSFNDGTFEDDADLVIIIAKNASNNESNRVFEQAKNIDTQIFTFEELQYNKTKHHLVPKHTLINDPAEIQRLLVKFQVKSVKQLPLILKTDPITRYFNGKQGDIFMIERPSVSAGMTYVYRAVA